MRSHVYVDVFDIYVYGYIDRDTPKQPTNQPNSNHKTNTAGPVGDPLRARQPAAGGQGK